MCAPSSLCGTAAEESIPIHSGGCSRLVRRSLATLDPGDAYNLDLRRGYRVASMRRGLSWTKRPSAVERGGADQSAALVPSSQPVGCCWAVVPLFVYTACLARGSTPACTPRTQGGVGEGQNDPEPRADQRQDDFAKPVCCKKSTSCGPKPALLPSRRRSPGFLLLILHTHTHSRPRWASCTSSIPVTARPARWATFPPLQIGTHRDECPSGDSPCPPARAPSTLSTATPPQHPPRPRPPRPPRSRHPSPRRRHPRPPPRDAARAMS